MYDEIEILLTTNGRVNSLCKEDYFQICALNCIDLTIENTAVDAMIADQNKAKDDTSDRPLNDLIASNMHTSNTGTNVTRSLYAVKN